MTVPDSGAESGPESGPDSAPDDLTQNAFLGGLVRLWQPRRGYRAGADPVLLAAAVPARGGQSVLDLGCGAGAAVLCLAARVPGLRLTGVDLQPFYADLARRNAAENGTDLEVIQADLCRLPADLRQRRFDHVIANPPYFDRAASTRAPDTLREAAMGEETPLALWLTAGTRRLRPRGTFTLIHRAARLPDLLAAAGAAGLHSLRVLPIQPRAGRDAHLVLVQGIKAGRAALRLHPPLVMHEGERHQGDRSDYAAPVEAILREGAPILWPD